MKKIKKDSLVMFYFFISIMIVLGILTIYIISLSQRKKYLENEQNIDFTKVGENINLKLDENIKEENVIYEVIDEDVVKINDEGQLVSTGEGSTKVIVKSKDGSKLQTIVVNVGKEAIEETKKNNPTTNDSNTNKNNTTTNNSNTNKNNPTTNNSNTNKNNTTANNSNTNKNNTPTNNSNTNKNNTTANNSNTNKNNTPTNNSNTNKNNTTTNNSNTNKNNTTTNNSNTNKNNTTTNNSNNSVVRVSSVSLNMNGTKTIYLNKENSLSLNATVYPTNATNKNITWSSSNTNVATVSNGLVKASNPGETIITVKTSDGGKIASMTLVVKKNIIIIVGASQVKRMDKVSSWTSSNSGYVYSKKAGTLRYVFVGGTGIEYQTTGDGMTGVKTLINNNKSYNSYINYFVFYPLSGNTIKNYVCNDGKIYYENNTTKTPEDFADEYIKAYKSLKTITGNLKGYVVSMHPVNAKQDSYTEGLNSKVVRDVDENSCVKGYRSNIKYYRFNIRMKNGITNKVNGLYYQSLFLTIMEKKINSSNKTYFNFKSGWTDYTTVDGVHWNEKTTEKYINAMLSYSNDL